MTKPALIIGNGISRAKFNLKKASPEYTTFGCNALYREFEPDFLIAIDGHMIQEIQASKFPKKKLIIPDKEDQYEPAEYNPNRPRENAGMLAMKIAIQKGYENLYCIGMDFMVNEVNLNLDNMYFGTQNYEKSKLASYEDTCRRAKYFAWFTEKNREVKFNMLFPKGIYNFHKINFGSNVKGYDIQPEFLKP